MSDDFAATVQAAYDEGYKHGQERIRELEAQLVMEIGVRVKRVAELAEARELLADISERYGAHWRKDETYYRAVDFLASSEREQGGVADGTESGTPGGRLRGTVVPASTSRSADGDSG